MVSPLPIGFPTSAIALRVEQSRLDPSQTASFLTPLCSHYTPCISIRCVLLPGAHLYPLAAMRHPRDRCLAQHSREMLPSRRNWIGLGTGMSHPCHELRCGQPVPL